MSRVVYLHIGAPKTGTTYLQDRLMLNQSSLSDHGVTIPTKNRFVDADLFHFRAALDLLEQDWGGTPGSRAGRVGDDGQARTPRQRHRHHQPRDPRPGQAGQDRPGHERPRGQRDPRRLLRPRPRPPAPGRLAGEHQAGSQVDLQPLPHQGRARPDVVPQRHGPAQRARQLGRQAAARAGARRHRAARPGPDRQRAVVPLLPRLRHRPRVGPARLRARQPQPRHRRDPAAAPPQPPPRAADVARRDVRRPHPRAPRPGGPGQPGLDPGAPAPGPLRPRGGAGRAVDRLDQGQRRRRHRRRRGPATASGRSRTPRGATPTGSAPSSSSVPPSTRSP